MYVFVEPLSFTQKQSQLNYVSKASSTERLFSSVGSIFQMKWN